MIYSPTSMSSTHICLATICLLGLGCDSEGSHLTDGQGHGGMPGGGPGWQQRRQALSQCLAGRRGVQQLHELRR